MLKKILSLIFLLSIAACAGVQKSPPPGPSKPQPVPAQPPAAPPGSASVNGLEQKVIEATNSFRKQNRLSSLKPSVRLIVIAQEHARNMAKRDRYGDTDKNGHILDGKDVEYRVRTAGYPYARAAENVGYQLGKADPAGAMMAGWQTSPGHRKNMLTPDITEIGVGVAQGKSKRWYFVQVFARPQPSKSVQVKMLTMAQ